MEGIYMNAQRLGVFSLLVILFLSSVPIEARAVKHGQVIAAAQAVCAADTRDMLDEDKCSSTEGELKYEGKKLKYRAVAGSLPLEASKHKTECRMFFVSYHVDSQNQPRPLAFIFNGGPGASSAYLHLGALGPRCIPFKDNGFLPPSPTALVENIHSWLWFTDMVFVDPVGTGYSRCRKDRAKQKDDLEKQPKNEVSSLQDETWGVQEDLEVLARFIRLYVTRQDRWLSKKFLIGESYGGFRVAALSQILQSDYNITVNGAVLVSPALEFGLLSRSEYSLLPWIITVPSFAATARNHGLSKGAFLKSRPPREALSKVESFVVDTLLPTLAKNNSQSIHAKLAHYIGLPEKEIFRLNGRIPSYQFAKLLLISEHRLISVYDGSWTSINPEPASPLPIRQDALLVKLNAILAAAMNSYLRKDLRFETDIQYKVLNKEAATYWNWQSGLTGEQGFVGVADNLKKAMSINETLNVFIAHGVFDLVTPYFGSIVVARQMALNSAIASNLEIKVYFGGHMFYTHATARSRFFEDGRAFFHDVCTIP
jgi:carboxypeptidase C (cathepsin A)